MMADELDDFERVLYYCVDKVYRDLRKEQEYLWNKLIDKSFGNDMTGIISGLFQARADIRSAYRIQKAKLTNK